MHHIGALCFAHLKVLPKEMAKHKVRRHHDLLTAAEHQEPALQLN